MKETTKDLDFCTLSFLEDDVVHAHFNAGRVIRPEEVKVMFEAIAEARKGRKALFIASVDGHTTLSNEARAYASSPESSKYIAADAIVVKDFEHQLTANVFIRHNKPNRPIRMFPDLEQAIEWLRMQQHLLSGRP